MPKQLLAGMILLVSESLASQPCLNCRRNDINACFLVTYSFCNVSDECVIDVWNYYNRNCSTGWKRAKELDLIEDCGAKPVQCKNFTSDYNLTGQYFNSQMAL